MSVYHFEIRHFHVVVTRWVRRQEGAVGLARYSGGVRRRVHIGGNGTAALWHLRTARLVGIQRTTMTVRYSRSGTLVCCCRGGSVGRVCLSAEWGGRSANGDGPQHVISRRVERSTHFEADDRIMLNGVSSTTTWVS